MSVRLQHIHCPSRVSIDMIKHYDQRASLGRRGLFDLNLFIIKEKQGRNQKAGVAAELSYEVVLFTVYLIMAQAAFL